MLDRVGANIPTDQQIESWLGTIKGLHQEMAPYGVSLTPEERKHTLKFRPGGEPIVHAVAGAVRNHNISLPGISADGMEADLSLVQKLKIVRDAAEALYQFVDDTTLEASSECWYAATAYYTTCSRLVSSFPDLKIMVAQVAAFFSTGRRRQSEPTQPTQPVERSK